MISSFRKKQTIRRYVGGYYDDNGEWHPGGYEEQTILASVQPANHDEAQFPEGGTSFNAVKIYSDTPLKPNKQGLEYGMPHYEGDILVWRGRLWRIVQCHEWQSDVISHYKMIAWEIEPTEEAVPNEDGNSEVSP